MKNPSSFDPLDLTSPSRIGAVRPVLAMEIYGAGKSKPVQQSDFFATMSEATRAGKAALAELRGKQST